MDKSVAWYERPHVAWLVSRDSAVVQLLALPVVLFMIAVGAVIMVTCVSTAVLHLVIESVRHLFLMFWTFIRIIR